MTGPTWIAPGEPGFLVGETLYLRALELGDAAYPAAWHTAPYPINRGRAEDILTTEFPRETSSPLRRLVACRRSDDVPVGSVTCRELSNNGTLVRVHADPALGSIGAAVKAEILAIVVPWVSREWRSLVVWAELDAPEPELVTAAEAAGMRRAVRIREAIWAHGGRHDQVTYELLHPNWVTRLGDPGPATEGEPPGPGKLTSRRVSLPSPSGAVPPNALLVSERLAIRMTEREDGKERARWRRQETERHTSSSPSRIQASHLYGLQWLTESNRHDPPPEMLLSVVLRQTNELIGEVQLVGIDAFHHTAETVTTIYRPEHRDQGYGTEAKLLLIELAFDHLGFHTLKSLVWDPNTRSQAALRKQGYRDAGRYHWRTPHDHGFAGFSAFDLLASEWRARLGAEPD